MQRGKSFPVDAVWVDRTKRQRRELTNIDELASSILRTGHLLHPITIRASGELIAGERRLTAVKQLGWTSIDVQILEELPEAEMQLVELEENVARVDLPWQDQCRAVKEYHRLRQSQSKDWNQSRTAEALNMSPSDVTKKIAVADALDENQTLVVAAPKYSTAVNVVKRTTERQKANVLSAIAKDINPTKPTPAEKPVPILNTEFGTWLDNYRDNPMYNLIHCDFPYGVGMHKSDQGAGAAFGTYEDSPNIYWNLINELRRAMNICVAPSAHLIFWFSMDYYDATRRQLIDMGWKVNPFPLVWHKSDNTGIIPDANRGPRRIYETAFFASRGDRMIVKPVSNLFSAPGGDKTVHMNQKPTAMLEYFLSMFADQHTYLLDPTCGSGSAVKVAVKKFNAVALGLERDPEFHARAIEFFKE